MDGSGGGLRLGLILKRFYIKWVEMCSDSARKDDVCVCRRGTFVRHYAGNDGVLAINCTEREKVRMDVNVTFACAGEAPCRYIWPFAQKYTRSAEYGRSEVVNRRLRLPARQIRRPGVSVLAQKV